MSNSAIEKRPHSYFIVDDKNRKIAVRGFSNEALFEHLNDHNLTPQQFRKSSSPSGYHQGQWCDLQCGARVFERRASDENSDIMRDRFSRGGRWFIDRGMILLRDYSGPYGGILRVKIFDRTNDEDWKWAERHRQFFEEWGEMSEEIVAKIDAITREKKELKENGEEACGPAPV